MIPFAKKITIFFCLLFSSSFAQIHNVETSLYNLFLPDDRQFLIFPEKSLHHPGWLEWDKNRFVELGFGYNDIFREWKGNQSLISINQSVLDFEFQYPFKWKNTDVLYSGGIFARYFIITSSFS